MSGDCEIQNDCVSSMNYPEAHGNDESCEITMLMDSSITPGDVFELETCCDNLFIVGQDVESSHQVPANINAGQMITWSTDFSVPSPGWQLCFDEPTPSIFFFFTNKKSMLTESDFINVQ